MHTRKFVSVLFISIIFLLFIDCTGEDSNASIIQGTYTVNHNNVMLEDIPLEWIDSVIVKIKLHYAHTSHGGQLTTGLTRIEAVDPTYDIVIGSCYLPNEPNSFCIFDGQESEEYITPELYWQTTQGMDYTRAVLNNNPEINVSMWSWCCQMDSYSEQEVAAYLDSISDLEEEFPDVVFVYMTGNAQGTGDEGYNRYQRNQQIRQYCSDNDKILFDFADLDAWYYDPNTQEWDQETYDHNGTPVPAEHPNFHGSEAGHTTYESCEQKGYTVWWLMAVLAGWDDSD